MSSGTSQPWDGRLDPAIRLGNVAPLEERIARLEQERDRQYEFNAGQIVKIAELEQDRDELKAQIARRDAPVSQREIIMRAGNSEPISPGGAAILYNAIIAARAKGDHTKEGKRG